jgi:RNA polymerase sigma factor (sigma-70 family)
MSDETRQLQALLQQVQQGSQEAARELADTYGPHVRRHVRRTLNPSLRPKFDSIDFVQLVWASFFAEPDRLTQLESPEQLVAYLGGMARHKVLNTGRDLYTQKRDVHREVRFDQLRRELRLDQPGMEAEPHLTSRDPTPSAVAIFNEEWERLVADQPHKVRRIVEMRYAGSTFDEIAAELEIHERTARKVIERLDESRARRTAERDIRKAGSERPNP